MMRLLMIVAATLGTTLAGAAETAVAVAANFTAPAEEIAAAFTAATGDAVVLSFGSTGAFYTQITRGAPFTVFLSADDKRPAMTVTEGLGVEGTVFTYAVGKAVLYSPMIDMADGEAVLRGAAFEHRAIADPNTAPSGAAAMEVLDGLGLTDALAPNIVTGENISQTLQFVDSANAELGFVALSQVIDKPAAQGWRVPVELYTPIPQDAVLLKTGENDSVAKAFMAFLKGDEARSIIERYGYGNAN